MAYQNEDNPLAALLPLLTGASDNPLAEGRTKRVLSDLTVLLNAAMKFEREKHIGVAPCEPRQSP